MPKFPRRWFQGAIVCLIAVVMLGAGGDANRFGRIGHSMVCVCGCGQILLECNHVGCPDSSRMIGELTDQLAGPNGTGADSLLINLFVAKYGGTVLAAPIRGGFDIVAWVIPLALFVLALFGTGFVVKTWASRRHAAAGPGGLILDIPVDNDTRERIRRETEW